MRDQNHRRGLSLIELLIVVAIIVIVMTMMFVTMAKVWRVLESWRT